MNKRALLTLSLACIFGFSAVYLARVWIEPQPTVTASPIVQNIPMSTLVVAKRALHSGQVVSRDAINQVPWPDEVVPQGAFRTVEEFLGGADKRVVLRTIDANEPITAAKVSGFGGRATLSSRIGENMRAVTIRVNEVVGVAGFVLPGDHVDVLLTRDDRNGGQALNSIILQNIKVLGVDQLANPERDTPVVARAVTLEVTPENAQKLTLAGQVGHLTLALRNQASTAFASQQTIGVDDLSQRPPSVATRTPTARVREQPPQITVYRALKPSVIEVPPEPKASEPAPSAAPPRAEDRTRPIESTRTRPARVL